MEKWRDIKVSQHLLHQFLRSVDDGMQKVELTVGKNLFDVCCYKLGLMRMVNLAFVGLNGRQMSNYRPVADVLAMTDAFAMVLERY